MMLIFLFKGVPSRVMLCVCVWEGALPGVLVPVDELHPGDHLVPFPLQPLQLPHTLTQLAHRLVPLPAHTHTTVSYFV